MGNVKIGDVMYYLLQVLSKEDGYPIVEESRLFRNKRSAIESFYRLATAYDCNILAESEYINGLYFMGEGSLPQNGLHYAQVLLIDLPDSSGTPRF